MLSHYTMQQSSPATTMSNKQKTEVSEKRYFAIKNISKRCVFFLNKVQDSNEEELVEPSSTKDSREKREDKFRAENIRPILVHWGDSNSALDSLYEEQSKEDNGVK